MIGVSRGMGNLCRLRTRTVELAIGRCGCRGTLSFASSMIATLLLTFLAPSAPQDYSGRFANHANSDALVEVLDGTLADANDILPRWIAKNAVPELPLRASDAVSSLDLFTNAPRRRGRVGRDRRRGLVDHPRETTFATNLSSAPPFD